MPTLGTGEIAPLRLLAPTPCLLLVRHYTIPARWLSRMTYRVRQPRVYVYSRLSLNNQSSHLLQHLSSVFNTELAVLFSFGIVATEFLREEDCMAGFYATVRHGFSYS